ncbi:hypothetical protein RFI_11460 [Reticulomyxa filosa]|uniref:Mitochondrial import inner membrane translocase subunit Tim21 n=1 Tax=Reticulomyxa filosa TaxID=46433 RepID=X6NIW1_RETFI|nr:hypothetical protein RFI_11460 [Reticulomyxa filosa]|eukprot:ETO25679.1 hypothetical protein RFI_11460 [Reticulomyxa filosa]
MSKSGLRQSPMTYSNTLAYFQRQNIHTIAKRSASGKNEKGASDANTSGKKTQGTSQGRTEIVSTSKPNTALSTFVVVKEKTEEVISFAFIFGMASVAFVTFGMLLKSLFSSGGGERIQRETFSLVQEDPRVIRAIGSDIFAQQVMHNVNFKDNDGHERSQVVYNIRGKKGEARVDVEMLNDDGKWEMQYCIVTTPFSVIPIVDNRAAY